jgi:uncharacterized protein (TIGR03083 family)
LRAAPQDLRCFAFLPAPSHLAFWARRQAHETAIHRADAQLSAGMTPTFDVALAQDGIAEMLLGFAARKSNAVATPGVMELRATDDGSDWIVTLGGERIVAHPVEPASARAEPDVRVSGTSGDLYLWVWNRPSAAEVSGTTGLAEAWRSVRVRWG